MGRKRRSEMNGSRPWSVRTYLGVIVAAAVVAVAAASAYGFLWSAREARDRAIEAMSLQAKRGASAATEALTLGRQTIEGLAAQPDLRKVFTQSEDCSLAATPGLRVDLVGPDGTVACSSDPSMASKRVHAGSDWLAAALRSPELAVDRDATDPATRRRAAVISAPIDQAAPGAGAVALFIDLSGVADQFARDYASSSRVGFTLVDRTTRTVLSASGTAPDEGARFPARTSGDWEGLDGERRFFGSTGVAGTDWLVYAGVRRSSVLADARGALVRNLLVGLLALLILLAAVWMLNRRVAVPLRRITAAVRQAARDPVGTRVDEAGSAELVALAHEFNALLDVRSGHEAQLLHQATHDPLTALPNKALLADQLSDALGADRDGVAVFCVGLERLDLVADGFGHDAGDRVLVEVATRLSDALEPGATLARFGAVEFVVLATGLRGEQVGVLTDRLLRCLDEPFPGPEADIVVRGAVGVATARTSTTSPEQLLRESDSAMREARLTGREWMLFDGALQQRATRHLAVEHALWQALQGDELVVHYQPLLEIGSGRIVAAEALVRWQHPERGLVSPLEFIPIAEETGQIAAIGEFVLRRACEEAAAWAASGCGVRMSVNVAASQLRDPEFPALVERILSETRLPPGQLRLEITESSLIREAGQGSAELSRLKALGIDLSMDDFGTGYSSLSYLHHLPVDELKVDRSFISRVGRASRDRHLVEAIVGMAQALELTVVAEGVETEEQLQFLRQLGCDVAQGFLFSPAITADELLWMIRRERIPGLLATTL